MIQHSFQFVYFLIFGKKLFGNLKILRESSTNLRAVADPRRLGKCRFEGTATNLRAVVYPQASSPSRVFD